jgi:hypothetical protein
MSFATGKLRVILWGLSKALPLAAARYPEFAERLKEHDLVARILAKDEEISRWYELRAPPASTPTRRPMSPSPSRTLPSARNF